MSRVNKKLEWLFYKINVKCAVLQNTTSNETIQINTSKDGWLAESYKALPQWQHFRVRTPLAKKDFSIAIAPCICLHLPFCGPGSNPKHTIYAFFNLYWNCNKKRTKINKKRPGLAQKERFFHVKEDRTQQTIKTRKD